MSRVVRKPAFCICENKDADQLRGNREADQRLCFRYTDSTIPLLPKYEISSLYPSSVAVQPGLCGTWSETPKTGFLTTRLICKQTAKAMVRLHVCVDMASFVLRTMSLLKYQKFKQYSKNSFYNFLDLCCIENKFVSLKVQT